MGGQIVHKVAGQLLDVQHVVLDGTCKGKALANLRVIELRPEDAGGVQQLQRGVHRYPLLGAGHAGAILGAGGLAVGDLVDEGGLPHVGNAQHHNAHHLAYLPLGSGGGQLVPQQLPDGSGEFLRAHAVFGVGLQHGEALPAEVLRPPAGLHRVGLIRAVEDDEPRLARGQLVHVRVAGGQGDAGVHDLADGVHILDLGGYHPLGFGHMTGEPTQVFDLHSFTSDALWSKYITHAAKRKAPTFRWMLSF